MIKILITGGGSGGHTMPAIAVYEDLNSHYSQSNERIVFLYVGSHNGIEKKIAAKYNISYKSISTGKFRRYFSLRNLLDILRVFFGFFQSISIIKSFKPDLIFSTGGFVSVPLVIAGSFLKKKIIIHEQTVDAGLANKIAGKFATSVALTFQESSSYFPADKVVITGIPLRSNIFSGNKEKALLQYGLNNGLPVIYVSGGGLGCHALNNVIKDLLPELLTSCNVIIQTGNAFDGKDYLDLLRLRENINDDKLKSRLLIYNFINDEIADIYAIIDFAIARSGAGTVNEFIALAIPAIFVPLPIATNDEQFKNAMIMVSKGTAEIINESDLTAISLHEKIDEFLRGNKLDDMRRNFTNFSAFTGNEAVKDLILSTLS